MVANLQGTQPQASPVPSSTKNRRRLQQPCCVHVACKTENPHSKSIFN
jgi:hypothetical protein